MLDLRPTFASALTAFGVGASITVPGGDPVTTTVVWSAVETVAVRVGEHERAEARRMVSIPLADVPSVPRGTLISAPEVNGETARSWKVDAIERIDVDHIRALVVEVTS